MDKLLIYYLPNKNSFIYKFVYEFKEVGYVNHYGHILVQVLIFDLKSESFIDYDIYINGKKEQVQKEYELRKKKRLKKDKRKKVKNKLINQAIDLLYRIKSR